MHCGAEGLLVQWRYAVASWVISEMKHFVNQSGSGEHHGEEFLGQVQKCNHME